ncbi:MAG: hypothetical protein VZR53_02495 [Prevotella sp.]|nr:hypothetical protein [Prevotella sp.]
MKIVDKNDYVSFDDIKSVEFKIKYQMGRGYGQFDTQSRYRINIPRRYEHNVVYVDFFELHGGGKKDCLFSGCVNIDDIDRSTDIKSLLRKLFIFLKQWYDSDVLNITIERYDFIDKPKI